MKNNFTLVISVLSVIISIAASFFLINALEGSKGLLLNYMTGIMASILATYIYYFYYRKLFLRKGISLFVIYSEKDKRIAEKLKRMLEFEGYNLLLAFQEVKIGDVIEEQIRVLIDKSDGLILIISSNSQSSSWVSKEISWGLEKKKKFFPVVIDKANVPDELKGIMFAKIENESLIDTESLERALNELSREKRNKTT